MLLLVILPKDNDGNDIPGIVGYEILRGSREGNRSIIAKGMINNLRSYNVRGNNTQGRMGLYPNYPFNTISPISSTIGGHVTGLNDPYIKLTDKNNNIINQNVPSNFVTFHSPDTNFRTPYLSTTELKLYGRLAGQSVQYFQEPAEHPNLKLIADAAVILMFIGGVIQTLLQLTGKTKVSSQKSTAGNTQLAAGTTYPTIPPAQVVLAGATATYDSLITAYYTGLGPVLDMFTGGATLKSIQAGYQGALDTAAAAGVISPSNATFEKEYSAYELLPPVVGAAFAIKQSAYYFAEGANSTLRIIYAGLPYRQFALQAIAEGFYSTFNPPIATNRRRFNIDDSLYLSDNIQTVKPYSGNNYIVNNLKRQKTVLVRTTNNLKNNSGPDFINADQSLVTLGTAIQAGNNLGLNLNLNMNNKKSNVFNLPISSHYAGLKVRLRNQYGQLDSINQIPITPCEQKLDYNGENITSVINNFWCTISTPMGPRAKEIFLTSVQNTPVFFGGDTYVNRYTEKNNMFFFYDWLYGQPDGYEYNYLLRNMITEPRFWLNSQQYDTSHLKPSSWTSPVQGSGPMPTDFYNLDYFESTSRRYDYASDQPTGFPDKYPGVLGVKESYFYLANSSVRDFFVESDVLVDFRQPGIATWEQHYDHNSYTDLPTMFNMNPVNITRGNYYAYDYSLSVSKVFTQYFSQGNLQSRYYNPTVSQLCYTYYPDRVVYSLPQQNASSKDSWFVYLVNNYKEFKNRITSIKAYAKTGMFITFQNSSPLVYQGVDTLQTDLGTKITIGDGGLFANPPQNVTISDVEYEYGSSQNKFGVIATPAGMYYISQNQGRVFAFEGGLKEVSQQGMKWWFSLFLPYKLTEDFPNYPHTDNPVAGIGTQAVYDNYNGIIYFSKKDYKLRSDLPANTSVIYDQYGDYFLVDGVTKVELGNPLIFENASWTASYDPKSSYWVSYHDWHPDFVMPARQYFMTTKAGKIWRHNVSCNSYCNFYGVQHPFEVEIPLITGQTVTTLKSMEYILECYKNSTLNCVDQYHVLDFNFDKAVVYNSEQVSGYLNLNLFPKNNITLANTYPKVNPTSIDILFAKEENKYRFNQFWDITKNRGEFPIGSNYPPTGPLVPGTTILAGNYTQEVIWNTQSNGYIKTLNPLNLDYNKQQLERKKFRHYLNFLYLSKTDSKDVNMIVKLSNSKNQISLR